MFKGQIGTSMILDRKEKKKKKIKFSLYKCPRCKNIDDKFIKEFEGKMFCIRCFSNYNIKQEVIKR